MALTLNHTQAAFPSPDLSSHGTLIKVREHLCSSQIKMRKEKYLRQVTEVWEDVHVPKAINGNDRAVCWSLLNVEEWVPEFITVSMQEVYGTLR